MKEERDKMALEMYENWLVSGITSVTTGKNGITGRVYLFLRQMVWLGSYQQPAVWTPGVGLCLNAVFWEKKKEVFLIKHLEELLCPIVDFPFTNRHGKSWNKWDKKKKGE